MVPDFERQQAPDLDVRGTGTEPPAGSSNGTDGLDDAQKTSAEAPTALPCPIRTGELAHFLGIPFIEMAKLRWQLSQHPKPKVLSPARRWADFRERVIWNARVERQ